MADNTKNIDIVIKELAAAGITNANAISGALANISKESGFVPQSEQSYYKTSNDRIRSLFSVTRNLTDGQLTKLKESPEDFFNFVYGGRFGNSKTEGFKYRGRGFNQLTFKDNYKKYGQILGLDLVNNPDLVNRPDIAAKVAAAYFKNQFATYPALIAQRYGAKDINDFKDPKIAAAAFYNANAGFGKDTSNQTTEGKTKAVKESSGFFDYVAAFAGKPETKAGGALIVSAILLFLLIKYNG